MFLWLFSVWIKDRKEEKNRPDKTAWDEVKEAQKQGVSKEIYFDADGHLLNNQQIQDIRLYYNKFMTPTILKMYKASPGVSKDPLAEITKAVHFPNEDLEKAVFMAFLGVVCALCLTQLEGIEKLSEKEVFLLADNLIGFPEDDFVWMEQKLGLVWKHAPTTNTDVQQSERPQYTFVEKKICVDEYIEGKTPPTECHHVRCGTPFLEARRREANNENGWKDITGHILTNEEVELFRKYYFVYMTPVVHKMFDDDWDIKNDFEYTISRSTFPKKPYTEREFEVYFYYHMMMPIVESLIPKYFVADRELTKKDLYNIADDILGEQDHDFDWLDRTYGIRWH